MKKKVLMALLCGTMVLAVAGCGSIDNEMGGAKNTGAETESERVVSGSGTESVTKAEEDGEDTKTGTAEPKKADEVSEGSGGTSASDRTEKAKTNEVYEGEGGETGETGESTSEEAQKADIDYSAATGADAASVESFLSELNSIVKTKDWEAFADLIEYPVTLNGKKGPSDAEEFLNYVDENGVPDSFIKEATNGGVIANAQGIGVGDGNIWLWDKNYDGIKQHGDPDFVIISINGI